LIGKATNFGAFFHHRKISNSCPAPMAKKEPSKIKSSPIPGKESGLPLCLNLVDHVTSFEYQEKNFLIVGGEESKKSLRSKAIRGTADSKVK
jgi:hypothetical protein